MIDLSKFFVTYTPFIKKKESKSDQIYSQPLFNPYSSTNLETEGFSYSDSINQTNLWDTLWTKPSSKVDTKPEVTDEEEAKDENLEEDLTEKKTSNMKFDGTAYTFISNIAPMVEQNLRKANLTSKLGLSELQIKDNVRRITLQFCFETGKGTNLGARQNNLGGMVYSPRYKKYGMYLGQGKHGAFKTLDGFFQAYFEPGSMYVGRYKDVLYANSDREFINRLKAKGYFEANANLYYNGVFNTSFIKAYNQYING